MSRWQEGRLFAESEGITAPNGSAVYMRGFGGANVYCIDSGVQRLRAVAQDGSILQLKVSCGFPPPDEACEAIAAMAETGAPQEGYQIYRAQGSGSLRRARADKENTMKRLMFLMILCFAVTPAAASPKDAKTEPSKASVTKMKPFGVELGAPLPGGFAKKHRCEVVESGMFCEKAPKMLSQMDGYVVMKGDGGLVLGAVGLARLDDDVYGTKSRTAFKDLRKAIEGKYGEPKVLNDYLRVGSIWSEPQDWRMAVLKNERVLSAVWDVNGCRILLSVTGREGRWLQMKLAYAKVDLLEKAVKKDEAAKASAL